jgi:glutamate synthase domain-containing protein 1
MLLAAQVPAFFKDLRHKEMKSALALIHMRFSTNTFPTWDLAHPFRMIAHNGEINTLRGNINWMRTREAVMESPHYGSDLKRMLPIVMEGQSDSATFDTVLELLVMSGRSSAACDHDDDSRGMVEKRPDVRRAPRLLRIPRHHDGTMGWSRRRCIYRR